MIRLVAIAAIAVASFAPSASAETLQQIATAKITSDLPPDMGLLELHLPATLAQHGTDPLHVRHVWRSAPRPGVSSIKIVLSDGGRERTIWARVRLAQRRAVVVSTRKLVAGERIRRGDLALESRALARDAGWSISPTALDGARVLRSVDPGTAIDSSSVQGPPPVRRGATIMVQIRRGRMLVSALGTLERTARPGELATVRLSHARKLVRARLLTARTARLEATR